MVRIRLKPQGKSKTTKYYKIVVVPAESKVKTGKVIDTLGTFEQYSNSQPSKMGNSHKWELDRSKLALWLSYGAQPSKRVKRMMASFELPGWENAGLTRIQKMMTREEYEKYDGPMFLSDEEYEKKVNK